jgi:diguanylate cyclase (GGDEF)-like protein
MTALAAVAAALPTCAFAALPDAPLLEPAPQMLADLGSPAGALWIGAYFGAIGFAILFSLMQLVGRRDALYGWYALYVFTMGVSQAAASGLVKVYLLPQWPQAQPALRLLAPLVATTFGLLLARQTLPPQLVGRRLHGAGTVAIVLGFCIAGLFWAVPVHWLWLLGNAYFLCSLAILALSFMRAWQRGLRQIHGFALGFAVTAVAAAGTSMANMGLISVDQWSPYARMVAGVLEALILTYALGLGLQMETAQLGMRDTSRPRDPATGFFTAPALIEQINALLLRYRRTDTRGAVIMFDISNWKDLTLSHGETISENMLKAARRLIASNMREADVAVRASTTRLALVLTRTSAPVEVLAVAQRIIDQGMRHAPELPEPERLHFHAAVAYLPDDVTRRATGLVQAMHRALDQTRPGSGVRLREIGEPSIGMLRRTASAAR